MGSFLMWKDVPVLGFDFDKGVYVVFHEPLLPYQMKGRIETIPELKGGETTQEIGRIVAALSHNRNVIETFFANRLVPLNRKHAKKIYALYGLGELHDNESRAMLGMHTRSLSLSDNYWVRGDKENILWKQVNPRANAINETITNVALFGDSLTLSDRRALSPELTSQGIFAKAWRKHGEKFLLYKLGKPADDMESKIEVAVSALLDKTNVPHVRYLSTEVRDRYACVCACMTTESRSILTGQDYYAYCTANGIDFKRSILKIDPDHLYKMWITDYLISNRDRHGMNWGFYYNAESMTLQGCHPLFDHNNAFDEALMEDEDVPYLFDSTMTMREAAKYAAKRTEYRFTEPVSKKDFLSARQYESFLERAQRLSIPIQTGRFGIGLRRKK